MLTKVVWAVRFSACPGCSLTTETRPGGEQRHYTYYGNGLRETETNSKGEITLYSYDDSGQLSQVKYFISATARTSGTVAINK